MKCNTVIVLGWCWIVNSIFSLPWIIIQISNYQLFKLEIGANVYHMWKKLTTPQKQQLFSSFLLLRCKIITHILTVGLGYTLQFVFLLDGIGVGWPLRQKRPALVLMKYDRVMGLHINIGSFHFYSYLRKIIKRKCAFMKTYLHISINFFLISKEILFFIENHQAKMHNLNAVYNRSRQFHAYAKTSQDITDYKSLKKSLSHTNCS